MVKVTHKNGAPLRVAPAQIVFLAGGIDGHTKIHLSNGVVLTVRESLDAVARAVNRELSV